MIQTKKDLASYLRADLDAILPTSPPHWRPWHRHRYPTVHFLRLLRRAEYRINTASGRISRWMGVVARFRARSAGQRLGFSIPPNVFGPGLGLPHWGTIVINDKARVGARCRLHVCTNIGTNRSGTPLIGDDCYIGPGAKLFGAITLGNRVRIGANAVVTKSFGDDAVLMGVPAHNAVLSNVATAHDRE